jgi:hypothetical protein
MGHFDDFYSACFDSSLDDWLIENNVKNAISITGSEFFFKFTHDGSSCNISMSSGEVEYNHKRHLPKSMVNTILSKWIDPNYVKAVVKKSPYVEINHSDFFLKFGHIVLIPTKSITNAEVHSSHLQALDFVFLEINFEPSLGFPEEGFLLVNNEKGFDSILSGRDLNNEDLDKISIYKQQFITSFISYTISNNGKHLSIEGKDNSERFAVQIEVSPNGKIKPNGSVSSIISGDMPGTFFGETTQLKTEGLSAMNIKLDDKEIHLENVLTEWMISESISANLLVPESTYKQDA